MNKFLLLIIFLFGLIFSQDNINKINLITTLHQKNILNY